MCAWVWVCVVEGGWIPLTKIQKARKDVIWEEEVDCAILQMILIDFRNKDLELYFLYDISIIS